MPKDLADIYAIALASAYLGQDASQLHKDKQLVGNIYAAPYLKYSIDLCFVVEDEIGLAGYIVGTGDTVGFEQLLEREWWPDLRQTLEDPSHIRPDKRTADQYRANMIHHPDTDPVDICKDFPAHIHMNLLLRLRGEGTGTALLDHWIKNAREKGIKAVHLGCNTNNKPAQAFWQKSGFQEIAIRGRTVWRGRHI